MDKKQGLYMKETIVEIKTDQVEKKKAPGIYALLPLLPLVLILVFSEFMITTINIGNFMSYTI